MIVKGVNVKGLTVIGRSKLSSIGDQMFWFDYRQGLTLNDTNRVVYWNDLSKNALRLFSGSLTGITRPYLFADGVGWDHAAVTFSMSFEEGVLSQRPLLNKFHNGTPHAVYAVLKVNWVTGTPEFEPFTTVVGFPQSGSRYRVSEVASNIMYVKQNGISGENDNGATNSVPNNELVLCKWIYYGDGFSNNVKLQVKASVAIVTNSLASDAGNYQQHRFMYNKATGYDVRLKMITAYELTGKSVAQIDAVDEKFVQVLKEDSEYSSLVTS